MKLLNKLIGKFKSNTSGKKILKGIISLAQAVVFFITIGTFWWDIETNIDSGDEQRLNNLVSNIYQYRENQDMLLYYFNRGNANKSDFEKTDEVTRKTENNYLYYEIFRNINESNKYKNNLIDAINSHDIYLSKVGPDSKVGEIIDEYITIEELHGEIENYMEYEAELINSLSIINWIKSIF